MYGKIKGFILTIPLMILLAIICKVEITLFNIILMYLLFIGIGISIVAFIYGIVKLIED
jgi:hypothetical protein